VIGTQHVDVVYIACPKCGVARASNAFEGRDEFVETTCTWLSLECDGNCNYSKLAVAFLH
jgi:hypothetical protein